MDSKITPLLEEFAISFAYLFGSQADGSANTNSDVDIAVYFNEKDKTERFEKKLLLMSKLSGVLKKEVDLVILNDIQNNYLLRDIIFHGKLIFEQNPNLRFAFETRKQHEIIDYFDHLKYNDLI